MDKSSLFQFLLRRYGTHFGVLLLVASCAFYFEQNTSKADIYNISILQDSKQRIEQAAKTSAQFLTTGKSKDLDEYNKQIVEVGNRFSELSQRLKRFPEQQKKFVQIQKKSRGFFLATNEKLEKRQKISGGSAERNLASVQEDAADVSAQIDSMVHDILENSSQSTRIGGVNLPTAMLYFLVGCLLACYSIVMSHRLKVEALEQQKQDISDLKIQSILLDGILNSISEALIVIDERGQFTRYNTAAQRIIGSRIKSIATDEDAKDFGFFDVTSLQQLGIHEMPFARALRGEPVDDLEIFVHNDMHPEGIYISASSRYLNDIDGSIRGALVVMRDISKRKATEKEWLSARESALETARKKSDFLAAMSHEIRTPMNGVIGMTTLLAETSLNTEQKDYVGTIKRSADALLRLINDILDHSKIEAGKVQMNPRPFDLKFLCEDILELFYPSVNEKNIILDVDFTGRKEWFFVADPERLRQILVNLIGNAVKFTEKGSVRIVVEGMDSLHGKCPLKISITDTGAGMSDEESQLLFQKYFQTKSGQKFGGTGLGLSICRQLVELMGGQIGVTSKQGLGSTFWFTMDLQESFADQIPSQKENNFAPIFKGRILLAEDQPVNQRVAATYLQKLGLDVEVAGNGQIAAEKALSTQYDLIFMDCQMPVMTGYDATKKIREQQKGERTTIVALTAEGTSGEKNTCFAAGMDDFLTKPLELDRLVEVLHRWLKSSPQVLDMSALEKLKTYVVNNKSLTQALIEDFMQTAPGLVKSMKEAAKNGQLEEVQGSAHALKSTSATLGAKGLADICQRIEDLENLEKINEELTSLDENFDRSQQELLKYLNKAAA